MDQSDKIKTLVHGSGSGRSRAGNLNGSVTRTGGTELKWVGLLAAGEVAFTTNGCDEIGFTDNIDGCHNYLPRARAASLSIGIFEVCVELVEYVQRIQSR